MTRHETPTRELLRKPAPSQYDLHELIQNRWSPRAFQTKPVEGRKVCAMLEAAQWAPSSYNEQPWRFFIGNRDMDPGAWQALYDLMVPQNQVWAEKAPLLLLSLARMNFTHNGKPNRHAFHDVGLATENLVLQAEALGLAVHMMAGFYVDKAVETLGIPPEYEPVAMAAIGYQAEVDALPNADLKEREQSGRERKPLQEICYSGHWDRAYSACFT